jgi:hypothetical protein
MKSVESCCALSACGLRVFVSELTLEAAQWPVSGENDLFSSNGDGKQNRQVGIHGQGLSDY